MTTLSPASWADFVVLGENPFTVPADEISRIPVRETWLGGERVYRAE